MFSIIQAAGWPIWPLLICSVIALALVIERFSSLRRSRIVPPRLLDEVLGISSQTLPTPEMVNRLAEHSLLGELLASGLRAVTLEPQMQETKLRQVFELAGPPRHPPVGALPQHPGHHRHGRPFAGPAGHGGRHDRDLRQPGPRQRQPGADGARHFHRALQHRLRPDGGDSLADVLPLLPWPVEEYVLELEQSGDRLL